MPPKATSNHYYREAASAEAGFVEASLPHSFVEASSSDGRHTVGIDFQRLPIENADFALRPVDHFAFAQTPQALIDLFARRRQRRCQIMKFLAGLFFIVLAFIGLGLIGGGTLLLSLGGSPYYAIAGLAYLAAALLLWRRQVSGALIVLLVAVLTLPWALWESGFNFWALFARLMSPIALAGFALLFAPSLSPTANRKLFYGGTLLAAILFAAGFSLALTPHGLIRPSTDIPAYKAAKGDNSPSDWTSYGRSTAGDRYSPFDQINRGNVAKLDLAWTYRTGKSDGADQNTPLQIGDTIYTCTPTDVIAALDADTGKPRWTFDPKATAPYWQRCRGLGYYKMPPEAQSADGLCNERLVQTTIDARLLEIDRKTGAPCNGFGDNGTVQLSQGMGEVKSGYYFQTSAPLIARNLIVIGGWVIDNQEVGEPSGVIRAFNVVTGELEWA